MGKATLWRKPLSLNRVSFVGNRRFPPAIPSEVMQIAAVQDQEKSGCCAPKVTAEPVQSCNSKHRKWPYSLPWLEWLELYCETIAALSPPLQLRQKFFDQRVIARALGTTMSELPRPSRNSSDADGVDGYAGLCSPSAYSC